MDYQSAVSFLKEKDDFLILMHRNPDGDAVGSAAALCSVLRRIGKRCFVFPSSGIPGKLDPFIRPFLSDDASLFQTILSVDVASDELLPSEFIGKVDLAIDHHTKNSIQSVNKLVKSRYSSCGEIIYQLICRICGNPAKNEAEYLYVAISTDTGCFQYANTSFHTLNVAAKLLKCGIDNSALNELLFRKVNPSRIILESKIYGSMKFFREKTISVAIITKQMMEESGTCDDDLDDIASLACRPKTAKLCVTIRETAEGKSRISLRSFDGIDCVEIASVFGGGGHTAAAGCTISAPPEKACDILLSVIDEVWR